VLTHQRQRERKRRTRPELALHPDASAVDAALAVFVLLEKAVARGAWLSRISGVALIAWAVWLATRGVA